MSGNRFDFLELAVPTPAIVEQAGAPGVDITADPDGNIGRRIDENGKPLAQVHADNDPRGYRSFLEADDPSAPSIANGGRQHPISYELYPAEVIGSRGKHSGQFNFPTGIAVDSHGIIYVSDSYNHRVQRILANGDVYVLGADQAGRSQLLSPQAVAVDVLDCLYVVEQGHHRLVKYGLNNTVELILDQPGHLAGEFHRPMGVAVSPTKDIYVADTGNSRVQRFDSKGQFIVAIGNGAGPGLLTSPQAVAVDEEENVYIADTLGHRIVKFNPAGRFIRQYGVPYTDKHTDSAVPRFVEPRAVCIDPGGVLYVADNGEMMADGTHARGRLQVIDRESGECLMALDRLGRNLGQLFRPGGLAIAPASAVGAVGPDHPGDIYIADTLNHRVLRFSWYTRG